MAEYPYQCKGDPACRPGWWPYPPHSVRCADVNERARELVEEMTEKEA